MKIIGTVGIDGIVVLETCIKGSSKSHHGVQTESLTILLKYTNETELSTQVFISHTDKA